MSPVTDLIGIIAITSMPFLFVIALGLIAVFRQKTKIHFGKD